jgi:predicted phage terminase large subunit-like protein
MTDMEALMQKLHKSPELLTTLKELAPTSQPSLNSKIRASRIIWQRLARKEQLPPQTDWNIWLHLAGRGAGKTRTAAEWLAWEAIENKETRWAIVAPTFSDVRDTCAEGESGIINILNRYQALANYNRSIGEIELINGSKIKLFSADEPDRFRGPQHHGAWCDELAAFRYEDAWHQLQFGLRLGQKPRIAVTTTPRPTPLIKMLSERDDGTVAITRGSTFDNAKNLAPSALLELQARYHGTRLGRQELYGEILEDQDGALWNRAMIEDSRIDQNKVPNLIRIVVAIDPAVTSGPDSDETGIVVAGLGTDNQYYILSDNSLRASPDAWARMAVEQYKEWKADRIIAEANNGGDMITQLIRTVDGQVPVKKVNATRGKKVRAEPISALYEQGRVHHVGSFPKLEDQMATWTPDTAKSPDRLDALVWALTELSEGSVASISLSSMSVWCPTCNRPLPKNTLSCPHCATNLGA